MRVSLLAATPRLLWFLLIGMLACGLPGIAAAEGGPPPPGWELGENQPEPFCPGLETTMILFSVAEAAHVELQVWNAPMTAVLKTLVDEVLVAGHHQAGWAGLPEGSEEPVPVGIYPYRMVAYYEDEPGNPFFDDTKTMTAYCQPTPAPPSTWAWIKALFR
ncbi:MAG: hypothetical protein KAY32_16670 [Candidatus Eisenbacteria sp.]|nr:hypothetical protein [Candidatus Eisenbacteria bacterium]